MKTMVVTGGIGSGKSALCRYYASKGIPVYDADSRTIRLYDTEEGLVGRICNGLGCCVADEHGRLDRRKLASVIFSDPVRLKILEDIVHPLVKDDFLRWKSSCRGELVVMESAIILEKPLFRDIADIVLLVDAPVEVRLERACNRDGFPAEQIRARMSHQRLLNDISDGKAVPDADFVVINDGDLQSLYEKADAVLSYIARHS